MNVKVNAHYIKSKMANENIFINAFPLSFFES
jgi:hypothetical protein